MPPKLNASQDDLELFRSRLENIIDQRHPLVRLARLIDWRVFEERFGTLYAEAAGRPADRSACRAMEATRLSSSPDAARTSLRPRPHLDSGFYKNRRYQ